MYIFIWQGLKQVSGEYHSGGGVAIIAENLARAKEIAKFRCWGDEEGVSRQMDVNDSPDFIYIINAVEEKVIVFPNAGCC